MNIDKIYYSNYETELKNGYLRIKGISHLGCLSLTTIVYDGDIRIPCEVIEKRRNSKMRKFQAEICALVWY
jgi:hypothetical protein|nr:MAG TPA: hypothetical protein [Caudoviricetes sp.]